MSNNVDLSPFTNREDDLEKALVLAAADADARNKTVVEREPPEPSKQFYKEATGNPKLKRKRSEDSEEYVEKDQAFRKEATGNPKLKRKHSEDGEDYVEKEQPESSKPFHKEAPGNSNSKRKRSEDGEGYGELIATHYNNIEEKGLVERSKSRIVYLRNFHNWIKSMLINEYLTNIKDKKKHNERISVLDIGCGKGGDLLKWKKGAISHLICSDIAGISLEQCKSRYSEMHERNSKERNRSNLFTIEYIAADCTKVRLREKYKDPSMKLDLVSCQFVYHYSFESLPQAECMLHNAAECLQPGGYFIGTIPDANDLIARARKAGSNTFGNTVFSVTFDCDINNPPLFGAKYHFQLDGVVDCPEFLVHFPMLVKLAKKYGLKLVHKEKFYDFYKRMSNEGRSLIFNMKGLETYPPYPNVSLVGTAAGDYLHAEEFLEHVEGEGNYHAKVGTLSKSEWEASSLYITFAFQKAKNTWAADGTPIYDI